MSCDSERYLQSKHSSPVLSQSCGCFPHTCRGPHCGVYGRALACWLQCVHESIFDESRKCQRTTQTNSLTSSRCSDLLLPCVCLCTDHTHMRTRTHTHTHTNTHTHEYTLSSCKKYLSEKNLGKTQKYSHTRRHKGKPFPHSKH